MKKSIYLAIIIFLTIFFSKSSYAQQMSHYGYPSDGHNSAIYSIINSFNIVVNKDYAHYAEYSSSGSTLDNEDANIPGVSLSLEDIPNPTIPAWFEINFSNNAGNFTYTGETNFTYIPVESTDHISYINYGFRVGYAFLVYNNKLAIIPNAGFEWMNWNRNVMYNGNTQDIEHYHFNRYLVGIKAYYMITNRFWLEGEGYYTHGVDNSMDTNQYIPSALYLNSSGNLTGIAGAYQSQSFSLGNKSGFLFGVKAGYKAYRSESFSISPFISLNYLQLEVNKSNTIINNVSIYQSGSYVGYAQLATHEPKSQTNEFLIGVGVKVGF